MTEKQIKAAAQEIEEYIRELIKPWSQFYGHRPRIAAIIRKHANEN